MFQTITKLYAMLSATATATTDKGRYIYFGATTIYCDENNVCSVYYPDTIATPVPVTTTMIVSSA